MKAMILAAGRGERLRPLTDITPKPLLKAGASMLIEYHLEKLQLAGINDVIINTAWCGKKIRDTLGDGKHYALNIQYSDEGDEALETAGGIVKALPLLGSEPFLVVNGDIWSDMDYVNLPALPHDKEAHLILVNNPKHNLAGDFAFDHNNIFNEGHNMFTYSGIGIFTPRLFDGLTPTKTPLAPLLRKKIDQCRISASIHPGQWTDVGTIERLLELEAKL